MQIHSSSSSFYLFACFLLLYTTHVSSSSFSTKLVVELTRHGARAPTARPPYQSASTFSDYWPLGAGQLTGDGMDQQYVLGQKMRTLLINQTHLMQPGLNPLIPDHQVFVQASIINRCLQSAESYMLGLFPPFSGPSKDIPFGYQPVPIYTQQLPDSLLRGYDACMLSESIQSQSLSDYWSNPANKQRKDEAKKMIDFINHNVFQLPPSATPYYTLDTIRGLADVLACEQNASIVHQPVGLQNQSLVQSIFDLRDLMDSVQFQSETVHRLTAGVFLQELSDQFNAKMNEHSNLLPFFRLYSAHDTTLLSVTHALGIADGTLPHFASTLIITLQQQDDTKQWFVDMSYNDQQQVPRGCSSLPCPLHDFFNGIRSLVLNPTQWQQECAATVVFPSQPDKTTPWIVATAVLAAITFVLVLLLTTKRIVDWLVNRSAKMQRTAAASSSSSSASAVTSGFIRMREDIPQADHYHDEEEGDPIDGLPEPFNNNDNDEINIGMEPLARSQ